MRQKYTEQGFKPDTLAIITKADEILAEYAAQNLIVTVRQLYYQFVARDLIPNSQKSYKRLADIVMQGRMAGLLDWDRIEDRGRLPESPREWSSIDQIVDAAVAQFKLPRLRGQHVYAELWVEKQALAGVLAPLALEFHVTLMVNKGYSSASAMRESALRFEEKAQELQRYTRKRVQRVLFYLGDHDPSGEDMVRDIRDRLTTFGVDRLDVRKVALTMPQIEEYEPPPNPAKTTDSRYEAYAARHGDESWELDALDPPTLRRLIRESFASVVDRAAWDAVIREEDAQRAQMKAAIAAMRRGGKGGAGAPPPAESADDKALRTILDDVEHRWGIKPFEVIYRGSGQYMLVFRRADNRDDWPFEVDEDLRVYLANEDTFDRDTACEEKMHGQPIARPSGAVIVALGTAQIAAENRWKVTPFVQGYGTAALVIFRRKEIGDAAWPFIEGEEVRVYVAMREGDALFFYRDVIRERIEELRLAEKDKG